MRRHAPVLLLLIAGILYGGALPLTRIAVRAGVPPLGYVFWQCCGALAVVWLIGKLRRSGSLIRFAELRYCTVCGLLGIVAPNTILLTVVMYVPVSFLAVVVVTVPLFVASLTVSCGFETLSRRGVIGILCGFAGASLILVPTASLPSSDVTPWILLAFLAPLLLALCSIYAARHRPPDATPLSITCGMLAASTVLLLPLVTLTGSAYPLAPPFTAPELAIFAQVLISAVTYLLYFVLLRMRGALYFSQVGYIVTLTGILWGVLLFAENPGPLFWAGAVAVVFGLALVGNKVGSKGDKEARRGTHPHPGPARPVQPDP